MEGTYDIPTMQASNGIFLCDYRTKSDVVFAEMQIISYRFIVLKNIVINEQFGEILMLKV